MHCKLQKWQKKQTVQKYGSWWRKCTCKFWWRW